MPDHVHMLISNIYSATQIIGYLKGSINSGRASVLCHDHWPGRGIDPGLHPKPRTGRSAVGAVRAEDFSSPKFNQSSKHPLKPPLAVPNQTSSFAGGYWLSSWGRLQYWPHSLFTAFSASTPSTTSFTRSTTR